MEAIIILLLLVVVIQSLATDDKHFVTCNSSVRLRHLGSKKYFLKSSGNTYSSGQQVVTLDVHGDLLWQIREAHNTTSCSTGEPVKCGEVIRLTHVKTGKNLHSHHGIPAPLSRYNNEVSGFGSEGQGDSGDNWKLECLNSKGALEETEGQLWGSSSLVRFRHINTMHWLSSSSKSKFTQSNCPHCPILGELEVYGTSRNSDSAIQGSTFRADDGVYLLK